MADYFELVPSVQPYVPDAPLPIVIGALRHAARAFCVRSDSYRHITDHVPAMEGVVYYDIPLPPETSLVRIVTAKYGETILEPTSSSLRERYGSLGAPYYYQQEGNRIRLVDPAVETAPDMLVFEISLQPTLASTGLDEDFMHEHGECIVYGALSYLLAQPAQVWSNPALSGYYMSLFEQGITLAKRRANNDDTPKIRQTEYGGL